VNSGHLDASQYAVCFDVAEVGLELIRSGRATITPLVRVTRVQTACPPLLFFIRTHS
jgi:hypothetical protein